MKRFLSLLFITAIFVSGGTAFALNTGRIINNKCTSNLKALNAATKNLLEKYHQELTPWKSFKDFYSDTRLQEFLKEKPESPTLDCRYFLVSLPNNDFQWCCDLHGVVDGDKTVSFMYHEHATVGKYNTKYERIKEYDGHIKGMLHWTNYQPTFTERIKYNYNMNPITTILLGIGVVVVIFIVYRTIY